MSRFTLAISAFACALLLMALAVWQLMIYLHPPAWRVALWSPFAGLLHAREASYIALWLVQFPLLAAIFVVASRRWSPPWVFLVLLAFYALCSVGAYFAVLAHPYGPIDLQESKDGTPKPTFGISTGKKYFSLFFRYPLCFPEDQ